MIATRSAVANCGEVLLSSFIDTYFQGVHGTKAVTTIKGERIFTMTFLKIVGDLPLSAVTGSVLERWRFERLRRVKPVTFNDERRVLSHIFNKAVEHGYLPSNPFKKLNKVKEQEKRLYLTSEELERFFTALEENIRLARNRPHRRGHYLFKLFCQVALNTGMRRSELVNLKAEHIDFQNNLIRVEQTKGKKRSRSS